MPKYSKRHLNRLATNFANTFLRKPSKVPVHRTIDDEAGADFDGNFQPNVNGDSLENNLGQRRSVSCSRESELLNENEEQSCGISSGEEYASDSEDKFESDGDDMDCVLGARGADIVSELRKWVCENQVKHTAVNGLLKILQAFGFSSLPSDSRTLLKTPRKTSVRSIPPGDFVYYGISRGLRKVVKEFNLKDTLTVDVNVDGIPLYSSSGTQFWPLQMHVQEARNSAPFFVAIWEGKGKPASFNEYLREFVEEAGNLIKDGFKFDGRTHPFRIAAYVCDTPARTTMTAINPHMAYYGCGKCDQEGEWMNRVVFSTAVGNLRTDEDFLAQSSPEHHTGETILADLPVGLVSRVPFEYQHLVCLGIMRKMLHFWTKGKYKPARLSLRQREILSSRLLAFQSSLPLEFSRKPRGLKELDRFKATEFRQFLLYLGPIVLKGILNDRYFEHFMLLHTAISILASPRFYLKHNDTATYLLQRFVEEFPGLYGKTSVSYNVHGVLHLAADSALLGPLDDFSTFKFENQLQKLKHLIKGYRSALQQVSNRLTEIMCVPDSNSRNFEISASMPHNKGPLLGNSHVNQFKILKLSNLTVRLTEADSTVLLTCGTVARIENIVQCNGNFSVIGRMYPSLKNFYKFPCDSLALGIARVSKRDLGPLHTWGVNAIQSKFVVLDYKGGEKIILPMVHTS